MPDMPKQLPPMVQRQKTRHGKIVYYVRPKHHGPRIRLRKEPFTPEWWAEYHAIVTGAPRPQTPEEARRMPAKGNLAWLIQQYKNSGEWLRLSKSTQRNRDNIFVGVIEQAGHVAFDDVDKAAVIRGRDRRKNKPFAARDYLKAVRALFKWAVANGHLENNPTEGVTSPTPKTKGFHTWTEDEIERFRAHWPLGTRERLALEVLLGTGLRRGDAVKLGRQHVRNSVIVIRMEKTGYMEEVAIPLLPTLADAINAGPTGDLTFIVGKNGRGLTKETFGGYFHKACKTAGVPGSAHGLRKAAAVRLAESGATMHQLMAWFGWTDDSMAKIYTRAADRKHLAAEAGRLFKEPSPSPTVSRPHPKKSDR